MEKSKNKESRLHIRNKNRDNYDLETLLKSHPELEKHIILNKSGGKSINFADPEAVKLLNKALLKQNYGINFWEFPAENLCPPIPGRADYLHYLADMLKETNFGRMPNNDQITALDIGTGATCIYPIIGISEYNWNFIGSDIDEKSLESSQNIIDKNPILKDKIELRLQENKNHIFTGIINKNDKLEVTICNPPFHESREAAEKSSGRKISNLANKKNVDFKSNFSGNSNEIIYPGGEMQFIENMIRESVIFSKNVKWFTTLVSKQTNLKKIYKLLDKAKVAQTRTIEMGTGNKSTRIVAWTY